MARKTNKQNKHGVSVISVLLLVLVSALLVTMVILRLRAGGDAAAEDLPGEEAAVSDAQEAPSAAEPAAAEPGEAPAAEPAETAAEPVPAEPEYFTISMVGDCTLAEAKTRRGWGTAYQSVVGSNYAYPFANTVDFFSDDYLTVSNLECVLSDRYYDSIEQFVFLAPAAYANILSSGGVEFVTLANNHTMDFGQAAYNDTAAALKAAGVAYAGENETYLYQAGGGLKVGLYCLYGQLTYNAMSILSSARQEELIAKAKEEIRAAAEGLRADGAEYLTACLHMGREGYYETTDSQVELCRYAIDCGFDLVYCTHAHRLQPAEAYNGGLIFYGMGNWSFGGHTNPGNGTDPGAYDTGIAQITVVRRGDTVVTDSYRFIPCCISSSPGIALDFFVPGAETLNNYQPTPYAEGGAAWERTLSMLNGTYEGANYTTDYGNVLSAMNP